MALSPGNGGGNAGADDRSASAGGHPMPAVSDHELLRCIGRGSYGEVWLARNVMGFYRAVKVVWRDAFRDDRPFERELAGVRRFEPISRSHEGFVDILHVGQDARCGCFYYVMELGDDLHGGQSIAPETYQVRTLASELGVRGRLPFENCLELGLSLSSALEQLHKHGLVHRDIKPSNILFVAGQPKLADMGLVIEIDAARSFVGTEGFIPPEGPGTARADVYSLGKVLYEMSTGLDRQDFPELPENLSEFEDPAGFLELNEVLLQACRPSAEERYGSAWKMHADLLVLANGRSLKRLKTLERRWHTFKRVGGIAGIAVAALLGLILVVGRELRLQNERRMRQVGANVAQGTSQMEQGDLLAAFAEYVQALRYDRAGGPGERTHRVRLAAVRDQCPTLVLLAKAEKSVKEAWFSADGRLLLYLEDFGAASLLDAATGQPIRAAFEAGAGLQRGAFSPEGRRLLTGAVDGTIRMTDVTTGATLVEMRHSGKVLCARFDAAGDRVLTGCREGTLQIWDAAEGTLLREFQGHRESVFSACFSPNGQQIVSASKDGTARVWDAHREGPAAHTLPHSTWVYYATFSPDGRRIATACADHAVRLWDARTGERFLADLEHGDAVVSAEWSPDGGLLVTACLDGTVQVWNAATGQHLRGAPRLRLSDRAQHASFSPDGHRVVTACLDGTLRVWDLAGALSQPVRWPGRPSANCASIARPSPEGLEVVHLESGFTNTLSLPTPAPPWALSPDGRFVLVQTGGGGQPGLTVLSSYTGEPQGLPVPFPHPLAKAVLSPNGAWLAIPNNGQLELHGLQDGLAPLRLAAVSNLVAAARFSPDQKHLAGWGGTHLHLWALPSGRAGPEFSLPVALRAVTFSPNGRRIAAAAAEEFLNPCSAAVWDVETGQPAGPPLWHDDGILSVEFSADGQRVVTASEDFTARIWEVASGQALTPPLRHRHQVQHACFSPDGRWVATVSSDASARLWDASTGDPISPPLADGRSFSRGQFDATGRRLFVLGGVEEVNFWDLQPEAQSLEDLQLEADLLNGLRSPASSRAKPGGLHLAVSAMTRLQARHPAAFTVTPAEVQAWHRRQAAASERAGGLRGAAFHLEHLLATEPDHAAIADRLEQIRTRLKNETPRDVQE